MCVSVKLRWSWVRRNTRRTWPDRTSLFSARPRAFQSRPLSGPGWESMDRWFTCLVSWLSPYIVDNQLSLLSPVGQWNEYWLSGRVVIERRWWIWTLAAYPRGLAADAESLGQRSAATWRSTVMHQNCIPYTTFWFGPISPNRHTVNARKTIELGPFAVTRYQHSVHIQTRSRGVYPPATTRALFSPSSHAASFSAPLVSSSLPFPHPPKQEGKSLSWSLGMDTPA